MKQSAILLFLLWCCSAACMKDATKYKDLLDDREITYPGTVIKFQAFPGSLRSKLQWRPSPDPSIIKYAIYWNNGDDSLWMDVTNRNTADSVSVILTKLGEYVQNFVLYTVDGKGNRSIGQSLSGVRVFGPLYNSSLVNRQPNAAKQPVKLDATTYKVYFAKADTVLNIDTKVSFTNSLNEPQNMVLIPQADSVILQNVGPGTKIAYRSSYVPIHRAVDTFRVTYTDTLVLK